MSVAGPAPPAIAPIIQSAADQVRRCYRQPRVRHEIRQISTRLHVRYAIDGSLASFPEVLAQSGVTEATSPGASKMAEAAVLAVIGCVPIRLPPEAYRGGWDDFELTFSPGARG